MKYLREEIATALLLIVNLAFFLKLLSSAIRGGGALYIVAAVINLLAAGLCAVTLILMNSE